jgi:iron complex outermembrane receptor protein
LFEIYAPNTQLFAHNTHLDHFGIRGIISDRDDKYLLRVDGKVMNNRYFSGAESERDLPLLGDLQTATVVHGPASATYGAGALAGVLNLETYNGLTFEGADAQIRQGFWDQLTAGEFRLGHKLSATSGLFLYGGVASQPGADQNASPAVYGKSFATPGNGPQVVSGQPVQFAVPNLHDAGGILKAKVHASYVNGPVEIWARYTQGGGRLRPQRSALMVGDLSDSERGHRNLSQQLTVAAKFKQDLIDTFNLEVFTSYDRYLYRLWFYDVYQTSDDRLEQEAYSRVLGNWKPTDKQSVALGALLLPRLGLFRGGGRSSDFVQACILRILSFSAGEFAEASSDIVRLPARVSSAPYSGKGSRLGTETVGWEAWGVEFTFELCGAGEGPSV